MTKNSEKKQKEVNPAIKVNTLLKSQENKKEKLSWWRRLLHFGKMVGDVKDFVYEDDKKAAEKIRKDIMKIEAERMIERRMLEEQREKLEKEAREAVKAQKSSLSTKWTEKIDTSKATSLPAGVEVNIKSAADHIKELSDSSKDPLAMSGAGMSADSLPELSNPPQAKEAVKVMSAKDYLEEAKEEETALPTVISEKVVKGDKAIEAAKAAVGEAEKAPATGSFFDRFAKKEAKGTEALVSNQVKSEFVNKTVEHRHKLAKKLADEFKKQAQVLLKNEVENRYWQPHSLVQANLIKEQRSMFFDWHKKTLTLVFVSAITVLTCLVAYGGLLLWKYDKIQSSKYLFENIDSTDKSIATQENKTLEIIGFNDKVMYVDYLLDNHIYFSQFFSLLEKRTIRSVYFESFTGDVSGNYKIPGIAKTYDDLFTQAKVMQDFDNLVIKSEIPSGTAIGSETNANPNTGTTNTGTGSEGVGGAPGVKFDPSHIRFIMDLSIDNRLVFLKKDNYASQTN